MPYITTAERIGMEKGIKEGERRKAQEVIVEILKTRFKTVPSSLIKKINEIKGEKVLSALLRKAIVVKDLEEFEQAIDKIS
ncbi:hypothetical protein JXL19_08670 [bacterium]|nr:hypothetical protein [bacterium]